MGILGHLHVSVVEGRNLSVKNDARPSVLLQIGKEQARTAPLKDMNSKWVAEFRLDVASEDACLMVTLLDDQSNPIGKSVVPIRTLIAIGTSVDWIKLKDPCGNDVGEICLVLRFLRGLNGVKRENGSSHRNGESNSDISSSTSSLPIDDVYDDDQQHNLSKKKDQPSGRGKYLVAAATAAATLLLSAFAWRSHQKAKSKYHQVQEGDTMSSIANRYGLSPDDVFEANMSVTGDPDRIYPGDRIRIP